MNVAETPQTSAAPRRAVVTRRARSVRDGQLAEGTRDVARGEQARGKKEKRLGSTPSSPTLPLFTSPDDLVADELVAGRAGDKKVRAADGDEEAAQVSDSTSPLQISVTPSSSPAPPAARQGA